MPTPPNRTRPVDPRWIKQDNRLPYVSSVWLTIPRDHPDFHRGAIVVEWADGERTQMPTCASLRPDDSEMVKGIKERTGDKLRRWAQEA